MKHVTSHQDSEKSETYSFTITLPVLTLFLEIRKFLLFIKIMTQLLFRYLVHLQGILVLIKQENEKHPKKWQKQIHASLVAF